MGRPPTVDGRRADLRARHNQLSIRREELVRRFPGSFGLAGPPAEPLGLRANERYEAEWRSLTAALQRVEAELTVLVGDAPQAQGAAPKP